jgi:fatty-acyl-CoA synthase
MTSSLWDVVIAGHPAVAQVGVIGVPDAKWREAVTAVIVLREPAPRGQQAIDALTAEIQQAVREGRARCRSPSG